MHLNKIILIVCLNNRNLRYAKFKIIPLIKEGWGEKGLKCLNSLSRQSVVKAKISSHLLATTCAAWEKPA